MLKHRVAGLLGFREAVERRTADLDRPFAPPATNLNDMPQSGALVATVSRDSLLFGQQARQFLRADWPRRRTRKHSARLRLTRSWSSIAACCGLRQAMHS